MTPAEVGMSLADAAAALQAISDPEQAVQQWRRERARKEGWLSTPLPSLLLSPRSSGVYLPVISELAEVCPWPWESPQLWPLESLHSPDLT
jgi:hypothetical protein